MKRQVHQEGAKLASYGTLFLKKIMNSNQDLFGNFLQTLDADSLNSFGFSGSLADAVSEPDSTDENDKRAERTQHLISLLKEDSTIIVGVVIGLFLPDTKLAEGMPCLSSAKLNSHTGHTQNSDDSLMNIGRSDLFRQLNDAAPEFGPRLICELVDKDEEQLISEFRRMADSSFLRRFGRILIESPDEKRNESQPDLAHRRPLTEAQISHNQDLELTDTTQSNLTKSLGTRIVRVHDTLSLLQATEDAEHRLILAPIRRQAAISIQAVARTYLQNQLRLKYLSVAIQTDLSMFVSPNSKVSSTRSQIQKIPDERKALIATELCETPRDYINVESEVFVEHDTPTLGRDIAKRLQDYSRTATFPSIDCCETDFQCVEVKAGNQAGQQRSDIACSPRMSAAAEAGKSQHVARSASDCKITKGESFFSSSGDPGGRTSLVSVRPPGEGFVAQDDLIPDEDVVVSLDSVSDSDLAGPHSPGTCTSTASESLVSGLSNLRPIVQAPCAILDQSSENYLADRKDFLCPRCAWTGQLEHTPKNILEAEKTLHVEGLAPSVAHRASKHEVQIFGSTSHISSPTGPRAVLDSSLIGLSPLLHLIGGRDSGVAFLNITELSLEASLCRIDKIFADKAAADATMVMNGNAPQCLPSFVSSWHLMNFGRRALAKRHEMQLYARLMVFLKARCVIKSAESNARQATEVCNPVPMRRLRQFADLLGITPARAPFYSPLVQSQFMLLLHRLFSGGPVDMTFGSRQHKLSPEIHVVQRQADVVPLSRVVCALVGSGLNVNIDEPVSWDAPYLLQISSETQLKQLLKKARALPQISRRDSTGIVTDRGIAIDDVLDLTLNFIFERAKEIQGRLRASFKSFAMRHDLHSWSDFSKLLASLDADPVSSEEATRLFEETQPNPETDVEHDYLVSSDASQSLTIDSGHFARCAWKMGLFARITAPLFRSKECSRPCEVKKFSINMHHSRSGQVPVNLRASGSLCKSLVPVSSPSVTKIPRFNEQHEPTKITAVGARRTVVADAVNLRGTLSQERASTVSASAPSIMASKRTSSRGAVLARLKYKHPSTSRWCKPSPKPPVQPPPSRLTFRKAY